MVRKILMMLICISLFSGCSSNENELTIANAFGQHQFKELYYVGLWNKSMPDTIEAEMIANPDITIEQDQFIFQNRNINNVEYVEDEFNKEEEQLYFNKKYKVLENGFDSYFRIYITYKNVYVGVYYNTVSMRYIVKIA